MPTIEQTELDEVLFKNEVWDKPLEFPSDAPAHVRAFGKLGKRRKLLALIALTSAENDSFPSTMRPFWGMHAGTSAWNALNWLILTPGRVTALLASRHITEDIRSVILAAQAARRCLDEFGPVLNSPRSQEACLAICQYGSLKQRASIAKKMSSAIAVRLVSNSEAGLVEDCVALARTLA